MNIQTFLNLTATTPARDLRRALVAALVMERPTAAEGYARLYERVIAGLGVASHTDHGRHGRTTMTPRTPHTPHRLGTLDLPNCVVMAPMTRNRAGA